MPIHLTVWMKENAARIPGLCGTEQAVGRASRDCAGALGPSDFEPFLTGREEQHSRMSFPAAVPAIHWF